MEYSENVVWSSQVYIAAIRDIISTCGFDPDIVQLIIATPKTVEALTKDERIAHTTFIGSETVGRIVARDVAETGRRILLELGGKDACVILPNTKLSDYYDTWMRGCYQASGQNCIGIERFVVHSS